MHSSSNVLLVIPSSAAWDVPAAVRDISSWLVQRGFDPVVAHGRAAASLTLLHPETARSVKLIITTTDEAKHIDCSRVLDLVLERRDDIDGALSRLVERLEHLSLLTTPMAFQTRDEEILVRRLVDLGYL